MVLLINHHSMREYFKDGLFSAALPHERSRIGNGAKLVTRRFGNRFASPIRW